ncbi:uncharacterized protein LOC110102697 [Dendrobium catenatum]|uniref:Uncharacterized protein n=1 Tax=Dendrobium catenatum TaxID=906689 RepID=A0A2I0XBF2_9ASPA|nr:uncharacterized protein LOC110102697 [Dendrobium catenatum]PKU85257.1 hypothetical protein MA16_Dca025436 [Dendrobium catenatum]
MRSFSKLGVTLLLSVVFALFLLCLAVTLLCFLCRRRRRRSQKQPLAGNVELGCKGAYFKESTVLNFLCCKIRSRVEPAGDSSVLCSSSGEQVKIPPAAAEVDDECALAMWRAVAFGPSRVLYTIKEEEREGLEFEEKEEDDLFATPCESPVFYTPASSPARAPEKEGAVAVCVSPPAPADEGLSIS